MTGGGGYTDDDVDRLYPVGGANDNPNPHPNGNDDNDSGTNHSKKKHGFGGWIKKRVNDVTDKVDEAHDWAKDHASEIGETIAVSVAVVGVVAFCAGTAGVGCLIVAGAVMGASGASLGYGARIALDDQESFDIGTFATEVAVGAAAGAAGSAVGIAAWAVAAKAAGAIGKVALGKVASSGAKSCPGQKPTLWSVIWGQKSILQSR